MILWRWYWFTCTACGWRGIRYQTSKTCQHCQGKALQREGLATEEERDAAYNAEVKRLKEIPE